MRYRRILTMLVLGPTSDRAHIERLIVGAVAPRLAHIDNSIGVERLAIVPRGDLHGRPSLPVKVDLGPRVCIGGRQVQRHVRANSSGKLTICRPVALDIARGDSLGSKRKRRRRGKVGRVALVCRPQEPRDKRRLPGIGWRGIRLSRKRSHHRANTTDHGRIRNIRLGIPTVAREQVCIDSIPLLFGNVQVLIANESGVHPLAFCIVALGGRQPARICNDVICRHVIDDHAVCLRRHKVHA